MKFFGKILGGFLGFSIAGPVGFALGVILGHFYDLGYFHAFFNTTTDSGHTMAQQIFFNNTFKIMGYIAKSDGLVSTHEIQVARVIMQKLNLSESAQHNAIYLFNVGKQPGFDLSQSLAELKRVFYFQPTLLRLFLEIQLQMASAEGRLSPAKKTILQRICHELGIARFYFEEDFQEQSRQYDQRAPATPSTENPYDILGVSKNATLDEVKKIYRRLMSQNHPDKLISKGLPPEMIKLATQKTQKIKKAYEEIKKMKK